MTTGNTGGTGGTASSGSTASTSSSSSTGGSSPIAICTKACQTAADCKTDDGAYDADNYLCTGGNCVHQGCKADAECATTYSDPIWVCGQGFISPVPTCVRKCQTAADCKGDNGAYAASNHICTGGKCVYQGCKTDAECATSFSDPVWGCGKEDFASVPICVKKCQAVSDCKSDDGAYDAANYICTSGKCKYQGCKTDAECATTYGAPVWGCGD